MSFSISISALVVITGFLWVCYSGKAAALFAGLAIAGCFGYRLFSGEEVRAVASDTMFTLAIFLIGWWIAKQMPKIVEPE